MAAPRSLLLRCLPFLTWIGELRQAAVLRADFVAGVTVALVLIPQAMAYAQLAGLPPVIGLYAAGLPVAIAALWGSSRQLATGPVALVSLVSAAALAPIAAAGGDVLSAALVLALLAGGLRLILGFCKLGLIVNFLSNPVIAGLSSAAALVIATSQLGPLLGVSAPPAEGARSHLATLWLTLLAAADGLRWSSLGLGLSAAALILIARRLDRRIPGVLIAVVLTTLFAWIIGYAESGGAVVGVIPAGLPGLSWPTVTLDQIRQLLGPAAVITLIGLVEAVSIAKVMAIKTRDRFDANQELIGQGLANVASAVCGGYPVSGSFSRSAVNLGAGARSGFSSVVTAIMVAATLAWFTPLLHHLPQATLAAIIIVAVLNLMRFQTLIQAWRWQRSDAVVGWLTFAATLLFAPDLQFAVALGVVLSLVIYLATTMRPHVAVLARHRDGTLKDIAANHLKPCEHILALRFDGRLYFANTGHFEDAVIEHLAANPNTRAIVVMAHGINSIDASGLEMLHELCARLEAQGIGLIICGAKLRLREALDRSGWCARFGADRLVAAEAEALDRALRLVACDHHERCPLLRAPGLEGEPEYTI